MIFSTVDLTIKNYRCFSDEKPAHISLRKGFTAFLGVNNSGKTSVLKFFYEFRNLFRILGSPSTEFLAALNPSNSPRAFEPPPERPDQATLFHRGNNRDIRIHLRVPLPQQVVPHPKELIVTVIRPTNTWTLQVVGADGRPLQLAAPSFHHRDDATMLGNENQPLVDITPYFRTFQEMGNTLYIPAFRNAINVAADGNYFDISVGRNVINEWDIYKAGPTTVQNEIALSVERAIERIFEYERLEINAARDGQTFQLIINGRSYTLADQGSGLAHFIVVLTNVAMKKPSFILIDEPETNLHPSLQLEFLTTLNSYASEGLLFATHSYGLARASANAIYTLRHGQVSGSEVAPLEATTGTRLSELLGELSFAGYRELGFDKILMVEGATDILTLREFLRLYRKDHRVVCLPLGGSAMINGSRGQEIEEVKRISENLYALIDSERDSTGAPLCRDRADFMRVCGDAKVKKCCVLERRAIENYFSDAAVKKASRSSKYRALGPFEKLKEAPLGWDKADNWRIARLMTMDDLEGTDLGEFIASL